MKTFWRVLLTTLTVLSLIFIFYNSLQSVAESGARSRAVSQTVSQGVETVTGQTMTKTERQNFHQLIRKAAHAVEYGAFTFFAVLCLFSWLGRLKGWPLAAFGFAALVSVADELLQRIPKGRFPRALDVLYDLAGAVLGLAVATLIAFLVARRRKKHELGLFVA